MVFLNLSNEFHHLRKFLKIRDNKKYINFNACKQFKYMNCQRLKELDCLVLRNTEMHFYKNVQYHLCPFRSTTIMEITIHP